MVLVKALPIGILHELLELPCNVGLHFKIFIIQVILRLSVTQDNRKGLALPNGLEISWALLFHVSKILTPKTLWSRGNSVLTAIPSILFPFVLALELR